MGSTYSGSRLDKMPPQPVEVAAVLFAVSRRVDQAAKVVRASSSSRNSAAVTMRSQMRERQEMPPVTGDKKISLRSGDAIKDAVIGRVAGQGIPESGGSILETLTIPSAVRVIRSASRLELFSYMWRRVCSYRFLGLSSTSFPLYAVAACQGRLSRVIFVPHFADDAQR